MWNISKARYNKKINAVSETRIKRFKSYDDGIKYLNDNGHKPLYLWHTNAANLNNPYMAIVETKAYKNEYRKITD